VIVVVLALLTLIAMNVGFTKLRKRKAKQLNFQLTVFRYGV